MPDDTNNHTSESKKLTDSRYLSRRPFLRAVSGAGAFGLGTGLASAGHETTECNVTIDFNRAKVARVFDVQSGGLTSLTVFYFDRAGNAQKQNGIDPTTNDKYGPLRVRYDSTADKTTIQIGGPDSSIRRVIAYGSDCRSAKTNPNDDAAGDNDDPTADFTWKPDPPTVCEEVTFTSTGSDPDGELIHYGWDFNEDGTEDAEGQEVGQVFDAAGDYDVTHTVIDDFGATDSITKTITVEQRELLNQVTKLTAGDRDGLDLFGYSVAVDGDTAIIGAFGDEDPNGTNAGSAYVFTRSGGSWSQQAKLAAADGESGDQFGFSVAVDGDTAIIGAYVDEDPNELKTGSAYVFTRSGGSWSEQAKLTADDSDGEDQFGVSVAIDGDTAVIGANLDEDPNGTNAGSAYVFTRSGGSWSQQAKLAAADGDSQDQFGRSVAVDSDTAIIGADTDDDPNEFGAGSVYVFTRSGGNWSQHQKLAAADGDSKDEFGDSVAIDGDTAVIGARRDEDPNQFDAGSAYVFTRSGGSWSQQAKLAAADGDSKDEFGNSVAIDGDTAVIGARQDKDPNGVPGEGSAYVFTRCDGSWDQQQKLAAADGDSSDVFGTAVAVNGDTAIIGASGDEGPIESNAGSAYVFER